MSRTDLQRLKEAEQLLLRHVAIIRMKFENDMERAKAIVELKTEALLWAQRWDQSN